MDTLIHYRSQSDFLHCSIRFIQYRSILIIVINMGDVEGSGGSVECILSLLPQISYFLGPTKSK